MAISCEDAQCVKAMEGQDDFLSVMFARRCMEFIYGRPYSCIDEKERGGKSPDLEHLSLDSILHEVEVKRGIDKVTMNLFKVSQKSMNRSSYLKNMWEITTDEFPHHKRTTQFNDVNKLLEPLLKKLEEKGIQCIQQDTGMKFIVDGIEYSSVSDSWERNDFLGENGQQYKDQSGRSIDPNVYEVCKLFGTGRPTLSAKSSNSETGGWYINIVLGGGGSLEPDDYVDYVIKGLEQNVKEYKSLSEKFADDSYATLFIDAGIDSPGTYGLINGGEPPYEPTKQPDIDQRIDELIIHNPTIKHLLIWRKNEGWSTINSADLYREHIEKWYKDQAG